MDQPSTSHALQVFLARPVGRRWLLKLAGSTVALTAAAMALPTRGAAATLDTHTVASDSPPAGSRLQFALGSLQGVDNLRLQVSGREYPLVPHTDASRAQLRSEGGVWGQANVDSLTHYVSGVTLPIDRSMLITVNGTRNGGDVLLALHYTIPPDASAAAADVAQHVNGSPGAAVGSERLRRLGLSMSDVRSANDVMELDSLVDPLSTAVGIVMSHPNVATIDQTSAKATTSLLQDDPAVGTLATNIDQLNQKAEGWASSRTATDADGTPSNIVIGGQTTTFQTIVLTSDETFRANAKDALSAGIRGVRNTADLGAVITTPLEDDQNASTRTWVQTQGLVPATTQYEPTLQGQAVTIKVKHPGTLFGTQVKPDGPIAADGGVPLRIYNNFVRWAAVYVQYLGPGGTNLSINSGATYPDTHYSKHVALIPQVFTVLGVPLWDTNSQKVSLTFPEGAHTARLLLCGLGSDIYGGGWRQYFPADAYHDSIAPTDEVVMASVLTGILTIGLTVFALASDVSAAAAWKKIRTQSQGNWQPDYKTSTAMSKELEHLALAFTAFEAVASAIVRGGATYEYLEANGIKAFENLWNVIVAMGSVIPKFLFAPGGGTFNDSPLNQILQDILTSWTTQELAKAVPIIGLVLSIVALAGDVATLAEELAETIVSPWVIENEVNLIYPATITISHDPRASGFPVEAASWRLEALIDGASMLDPITGTINEDGHIRSEPLALQVEAPFGGANIAWSVVLLDKDGQQLATGVSQKYANDNPDNPPQSVACAITALPAPVSADTTFKRADTITHAADGYTWSDQVSVDNTIASSAIQEPVSIAVSTLSGVVATTWKQADKYYVRAATVVENGQTIPMPAAQVKGWARRPFVLLDSFVERADAGNHYLLEPDDAADTYQVRKLTLDVDTGGLSWDANLSYGTLTLPPSAAAVHSSGHILTVHAGSGRLSILNPTPTAAGGRPALASYRAGSGTQPGLLQSPIAVAVTNPGIALVLDQSNQIAAFDLQGDPAPYFPNSQYAVSIPGGRTYLDLAVDGAAHLYLLSYAGSGNSPEDYRLDVLNPDGSPLAALSTGVNIAHLAVDYWRSVYGVNYAALGEQNDPFIDPALGVAEPSISRFDPENPS
jgi:hypothetical protein